MVIYSREKVARLREQYPAGTRICLNSMDGEAGMPQGLEGTVQYVGHPEEKPRKKRESDLQR